MTAGRPVGNAESGEGDLEEKLRQLQAVRGDDVLDIGESPAALVEAWPGASNRMVITPNRRGHYLSRHPEMSLLELELLQALLHPDELYRDERDDSVAVFYRSLNDGGYLRVVVRLPMRPGYQNSVMTAYRRNAENYARHRGDGERIWQRVEDEES